MFDEDRPEKSLVSTTEMQIQSATTTYPRSSVDSALTALERTL